MCLLLSVASGWGSVVWRLRSHCLLRLPSRVPASFSSTFSLLFCRQQRFPGMFWDCCSGFGFCVSHRYYLKNNMETETLCSDEDAQELLRESQISLLQLSTVEVATQLSMRNFELFRNIEPTEYIDDLFKLKSKTSCANLKTFEEVINQETFWVASEILRETNQLKRMKIIKHFIKIALHCRECKNFNSMFAIIRWEHVHCKSWFSLQVKKYYINPGKPYNL